MNKKEVFIQSKRRASEIYEGLEIFFKKMIDSNPRILNWSEYRKYRKIALLSFVSLDCLMKDNYVFFNPSYRKEIIANWKDFLKDLTPIWKKEKRENLLRSLDGKIRIYEGQLKSSFPIGGVGERFVDLSSSVDNIPCYLSVVFEYEPLPDWGEILLDFRKLLIVQALTKVGVFHLPHYQGTSRPWTQDEKTGETKQENWPLNSIQLMNKCLEEMKDNIQHNELEHSYSIYLVAFIHNRFQEGKASLYGYLIWKRASNAVKMVPLEQKIWNY